MKTLWKTLLLAALVATPVVVTNRIEPNSPVVSAPDPAPLPRLVRLQEDDPRWQCDRDGNRRCNRGPVPAR